MITTCKGLNNSCPHSSHLLSQQTILLRKKTDDYDLCRGDIDEAASDDASWENRLDL